MTAREDAGDRLRRLLAIVPWLLSEGGATIAEIAERFGVDETRVARDLSLAGMCGVAPFTPDELVDIVVMEDGTVEAQPGKFFARPLRLTATEGFTLLAAGRTLLAVPGVDQAGALARALEKLAAALGGAGIDVELEEPEHLQTLRAAADEGRQVEIEYYTASRDEVTTRAVDPLTVFAAEGHWHLIAHCHLVAGERDFRVDRIRGLTPTGERFDPRPPETDPTSPVAFRPGADAEAVTLLVPAAARWVAESYPTRSVEEEPDGRLRVELAVSGRAWLERLLLRVGPDAEVIEPAELRDAGAQAAARVLARYR